jgi:uncharacterized oligopeptide transporter (OPT) family protein
MSKPIRIKLYGFLWLTKHGYYLLMSVGVALLVGLLIAWLVIHFPAELPKEVTPAAKMWFGVAKVVWTLVPWIALAGAVLEGIESYLVLRRFAQEEKVQRALAEPPPKK